MGRAWRVLAASALALGLLGAAACSDDDDDTTQAEDEPVTEEDYAATIERLCEQHGAELQEEMADVGNDASDAEIVSFYRVDYIPRVRATMEALVAAGLPPDRAADLLQAYNEINDQLVRLNGDPYGLIDRTRNGDETNEGTLETLTTSLNEDLATAGINCLPATNLA